MIARRLREDLPPYSTTDLHWWTARNDDVGADDIRNVYQALCSSLNQIRKLDLFFVFLSTNYKLSDCSPSSRHSVSWSARIENSGVIHHVQTPYTELPFDVWNIIGTSLDNRPIGPSLGESFKDGYIMFTHFGRTADDWCISDQFAFMALTRNMAIACRERIKSVDLCIPIHFGKEERLWPVQYSYPSRTRRRMWGIIAPISTLVRWSFLLPSKDQSST